MHQCVGQPVLVFLRRPPTLADQHPVHVPPRKHPEDIPRGPAIKRRPQPSCFAQGNDHLFLPLIAQAFPLLFQFCQFGRNHAGASQQIERCALRVVNLPGKAGGEPQTSFRFARAQRLAYGVLVIGPKGRQIKKLRENSRLRLEEGIHALGRHLRPPRDGFDGHSGIAFALQEPPGGFDDAPAGVARLALPNQRFVGTLFYFRHTAKL